MGQVAPNNKEIIMAVVKNPCIICGSKSRVRTVDEGYQVICIDNGHTANVFGASRSEAVRNWNQANLIVTPYRDRRRQPILCPGHGGDLLITKGKLTPDMGQYEGEK